MTLYNLNETIIHLIEQGLVADENGEVVFTSDDLEQLMIDRKEKIENIGLYIKELEAEANAIKNEKTQLNNRQQTVTKKVERLRTYLQDMLYGEKYDSPRLSISYRKSESLNVKDDSKIPNEFLKYSDPEIDKVGLKKAIKNGLEIEGVEIITNTNMQIK